ncbi:prolyl oligopeptidase family serine peptidase [Nonomuraea sp. NPDC059007]|uniref:alpha/beta hydrolase family protein n=1 Tax=Nonomuraea sp. NPDC059007 TaxID=3346692 RepID=UPI0036744C2A
MTMEIGPPVTFGRPERRGRRAVTSRWLVERYGRRREDPVRLAWLADSRRLLVAYRDADGTPYIEIKDTASAASRSLAAGTEAVLSPDRGRVAYRGRDGQVRVVPVGGGRPVVVKGLRPAAVFGWSGDGLSLVYAVTRTVDPARLKGTRAKVVDALLREHEESDVFVRSLDADAEPVKLLTTRPAVESFEPVPGTDEVLMLTYGDEGIETNTYLWVVSVTSGQSRLLLDDPGGQPSEVVVSPDGAFVAFEYARDEVASPAYMDLGIVAVSGGTPRRVPVGACVGGRLQWAADGTLYAGGKAKVFQETYAVVDALGKAEAAPLHPGRGDATGVMVSPDGTRVARVLYDVYGGEHVEIIPVAEGRAAGAPQTVTTIRPAPAGMLLGTFHEVSWHGADGLRLHGLVLLPAGYEPGRRCPTVVDVHGGPEGGVHLTGGALLTSSPVEWQLWAGKGYAVFVPDYRSSAIPGWEAVTEAKKAGDFAERDGLDVISGVRALVEAGIADPDRLALTGFSAGADTGCYLLTQTSMFRAAVLNDGWAEHFYAPTAIGGTGSEMQEWQFGGPPWQHDDDRVLRNSATHRARAITTPTLFVAGGQAAGGPAESFSWRYLAASMRRRGVDVRFLIYPDEGHGLDDPRNQRDLIDRAAAWIDARCT